MTKDEMTIRNFVGSGLYTEKQARDRVMAPALEKHLVFALSRSWSGGLAPIALSDVDELVVKNFVAAGFTRERAIGKIRRRRSRGASVMQFTREATRSTKPEDIEATEVEQIVYRNLMGAGYTREKATAKVLARRNG